MAKPAPPRDGVTVALPVHNAAAQLAKVLPAWGAVLGGLNRPFQIIVVNDGSLDGTAPVLAKLSSRVPNVRVIGHDAPKGFGACLRAALAEATEPLFLYAGIDAQYTPSDIRPMLERIELRDEVLGKQPDLISGARAGGPRPAVAKVVGGTWGVFWRVFAGLPITDSAPWYDWGAWWYKTRARWVFGVPLADVNSAFKLYRTAFLKRFPIQSDGDFVHTELVAKATFLTSVMDEVPLTPKAEPRPPLGPVAADRRKVFRAPAFAFRPVVEPKPLEVTVASAPEPEAPGASPPPAQPAAEPKLPTPLEPPGAPAPEPKPPEAPGAPAPEPKPPEASVASVPPAQPAAEPMPPVASAPPAQPAAEPKPPSPPVAPAPEPKSPEAPGASAP